MLKNLGLLILASIVSLSFGASTAAAGDDDRVLIFAAASTINALTDVCEFFNSKGTGQAVASFGSPSTLAKQIESGAPADVFISANLDWMDYLEDRDLIDKTSRRGLWSNRIVLIAPKDSAVADMEIKPGFPLAEYLGGGRLAIGDPDHVPAGMYGKKALENLGVWPPDESGLARTKDVRAALALVERGECPLGIVYATDAAISDKVKVVGIVPEDVHPPIVYPAAIVPKDARASVRAFFEFLQSPESKAIFEKYGFRVR